MDVKEFKRLILPLSGKLLGFAQKFLNEKQLAEDAVQDVFVRLWKRRDTLGKIDSIEAYSMRVTRNICIDKNKEKAKYYRKRDEINRDLPDEIPSVDVQIENAESAMMVRQIIQSLPESQRMVIYLRDIEHYEFEEISDILKLNNGAVRTNLSRARKRVRDEMDRLCKYEK